MPAHTRYAPMPEALWRRERLLANAYRLSTAQLDGPGTWPASTASGWCRTARTGARPERLSAVRTARERDIPLLATCGGFLHVLLGFARHVCALDGAAHAENSPAARFRCHAAARAMRGLSTSSPAHRPRKRSARVRPWSATRAHTLSDPPYAGTLRDHGLRFTAHDDGHPCIAELPGHRFFLSTLFQPALADDTSRPHPLVRAFASAAVGRSTET
ncbi:hypothetical protein [Streptomyces microflavus]|uniref:hypothetical protein n=1 Tax=Streptomyces microflavus TaxID=1919 RepID=UPI00339F9AE0